VFIMSKILVFLADKMADFEINLTCHLLAKNNLEIIPIAYEKSVLTALSGLKYIPRFIISEVTGFSDIDGLIIPGGFHCEQREELTRLIQKLHSSGKLTAAICAGPQYLARAGLFEKTHYTTTMTVESHKEFFSKAGNFPFPQHMFLDKPVVREGNVITAKGSAFIDFSIEILDYFGVFKEKMEKLELAQQYNSSFSRGISF